MSSQAKQYISFPDRHLIRDIYIPLERETEEKTRGYRLSQATIDQAYAYTGSAQARLLFDPSDKHMLNWLLAVYQGAQAHAEEHDNFRMRHEDTMFRAHRVQTVEGFELALRKLPEETPTLDELRMPHSWRVMLQDTDLLRGGLFLFIATNGMGKTTTCSSAVKSRLLKFDGFAVTVEDPCELPLHGFIGAGRCNQIPVVAEPGSPPGTGFAEALMGARRYFPAITGGGTILMIGEIRNKLVAAETLLAANEGHCVFATFHGSSIENGLMRFATMASETIGNQAMDMLASTLKGALHQQLELSEKGEGWARGTIRGNALWNPGHTSNVGEAIRQGRWKELGDIVGRQNTELRKLKEDASVTMATIKQAVGK